MKPEPIGPLLTVLEACAYLKVSRRVLYDMMRTGVIPSLKVQGSRRISQGAVERYLAARQSEEQGSWVKGAAASSGTKAAGGRHVQP